MPQDADLARAMAAENLRADLKRNAHPLRYYIKAALENGCNAEYIALRYGLPVADVEKAKEIWERQRLAKTAEEEARPGWKSVLGT